MREVTGNELSRYKILPFDLYDEHKNKILEAGEILTPSKIIMLKNYTKILTEDFSIDDDSNINDENNDKFYLKSILSTSYNDLENLNFETVVNKTSFLKVEEQMKIKYFYKSIIEIIKAGYYEESLLKISSLIKILIENFIINSQQNKKGSKIRFLGEYELCHPLNVAIIAGLIAQKLDYSTFEIEQIMLASILHDVGKILLLPSNKNALITENEEEVMQHSELGYDLLKEKFKLSEKVAMGVLEHHENNDGSGYPNRNSSDYINEYSQIINVANFYDNLAFNRTTNGINILNNREALRKMLEIGTSRFSAKILFTFIHMFSYNDSNNFSDLSI